MARDRELEEIIGAIDLFGGLSKGQVKKLTSAARKVTHPPGRAVATEGLGALAFHLVLEGTAAVSRDGRELRTLGPGDYFGEISMIDGKPRSATVTAVDDLTLLAIPHQEFEVIIDQDPDFARALLKTLCARLREADARTSA